jgi:hypothetical protein
VVRVVVTVVESARRQRSCRAQDPVATPGAWGVASDEVATSDLHPDARSGVVAQAEFARVKLLVDG